MMRRQTRIMNLTHPGMRGQKLREFLGVDSLGYLSMKGLLASVPIESCGYCTACFDGSYPVPVEKVFQKTLYDIPMQEIV